MCGYSPVGATQRAIRAAAGMIAAPTVEQQRTMAEAWVYLLSCRDGTLYCGWTSDLERRLKAHENGSASRYTASRLPVALALAQPMPDRGAARREEVRIKRLTRAEKLALVAAGPVAVYGSRGR